MEEGGLETKRMTGPPETTLTWDHEVAVADVEDSEAAADSGEAEEVALEEASCRCLTTSSICVSCLRASTTPSCCRDITSWPFYMAQTARRLLHVSI